jgi:hypothetical protein
MVTGRSEGDPLSLQEPSWTEIALLPPISAAWAERKAVAPQPQLKTSRRLGSAIGAREAIKGKKH